ncbi:MULTISPECIES: hypothetical protein [Actinomadura]|uniref:hypothetical protein n=1 Tax=Actinomadura sp. NPDC048021 TaxID=3155385 RepID=UPI0033F8DB0E
MEFQRLSQAAALEVVAGTDIDPSEAAQAISRVDQYGRDAVISAMAAGATGDEAVDALERGVDMGRYTQQVGYGRPHEEAILRSLT